MFETLRNLFTFDGENNFVETDVVREKFARSKRAAESQVVTAESDAEVPQTVPRHKLLSHWIEVNQINVEKSGICELEPHVKQTLDVSASMLQPGFAETFNTCRAHPMDELNARRNKTEERFSPSRFVRKPKRESA